MKILLTFIFAQLSVGILDNAFAAETPDLFDAFFAVRDFFNILNVFRMQNNIGGFRFMKDPEIIIRDKCTRIGGPNAYENAKKAQKNLRYAVDPLINEVLTNRALGNFKSWNAQDGFSTMCRIFRPVRNSTTTALASFNSCLDEGERYTANTRLNSLLRVIEFGCEDNGRRLLAFFSDGGYACRRKLVFFNDCIEKNYNPFYHEYPHDRLNPVHHIGAPWYYEAFSPNLSDCQQNEAIRNCWVEFMKTCGTETLPKYVDSAFEVFENASGCDNLLKTQRTSAAEERKNSNRSDQREYETTSRGFSVQSTREEKYRRPDASSGENMNSASSESDSTIVARFMRV